MAERKEGFADLVEALTIFEKYLSGHAGTHCEHDVLTVCGVEPEAVSEDDVKRLDELGFWVDESEDCFRSFRWGSC